MILVKCDRCGQIEEVDEADRRWTVLKTGNQTPRKKDFHLCKMCGIDLTVSFLNNQPTQRREPHDRYD